MYYDRLTDIFKIDLTTYSESTDSDEIQLKLGEWERAGYLVILKPVKQCADREPCIRLLGPIPLSDDTSKR
jgi:hypothetical protein